jgi:hypothetical protein
VSFLTLSVLQYFWLPFWYLQTFLKSNNFPLRSVREHWVKQILRNNKGDTLSSDAKRKEHINTKTVVKHLSATRTTQKTRGGLRYPGKLAVPASYVAHVVLLVYYFELTKKCTRCLWEVILRLGNPCRCIDWHERVVCLVLYRMWAPWQMAFTY